MVKQHNLSILNIFGCFQSYVRNKNKTEREIYKHFDNISWLYSYIEDITQWREDMHFIFEWWAN